MRDYAKEARDRAGFISDVIEKAGALGVVFGNSGGKDSALVAGLLKLATPNVAGVIMPCFSRRNYGEDRDDALEVAKVFDIETIEVDLTAAFDAILAGVGGAGVCVCESAKINIAPRLRMTTLYLIAQSRNYLVVGTGNASERHVGYFTKWGDGAFDLNPIADLPVSDIYPFLKYLGAPERVIKKPPSAGLFDGQTDETDMGIAYSDIDAHLRGEVLPDALREKIEGMHRRTEHKRQPPALYFSAKK